MSEIPTGYACPTCDGLNVSAMLYAQQFGAAQGYYCRNGHRFEDMGDLMQMNPKRLPVPMKKTIQQGYETVSMEIPSDLKASLISKFGTPDQLSATLGAVLKALASPKCFIMSEEDIDSLEKLTGVAKLKNAREVVGIVSALIKRGQGAEHGGVVATGGEGTKSNGAAKLPEGTIMVDLRSHLAKLNALVKFRNETPQQIIESAMKQALDGGWA